MLTACYFANAYEFRPGFIVPINSDHSEVQPIDAPETIAAGSMKFNQFSTIEGGYVGQSMILRGMQ